MSSWRRKALSLFPKYKEEIEKNFSTYDFWFDFLPLTKEAHVSNDTGFLTKIYGLAEWCTNQSSKDLWNSTAVCFYEDLLNVKKILWPEILPWISDSVIYKHNIKGLWNSRLGKEESAHLETLLKQRKESNSPLKFAHHNLYTTGAFHKL